MGQSQRIRCGTTEWFEFICSAIERRVARAGALSERKDQLELASSMEVTTGGIGV